MNFEWDSTKAAKNLLKHRVSFEEASSAFYDPMAATGANPNHSEGEERLVTFGVSSGGRLLVGFPTERGEGIRIISARPATQGERHIYEEG